MVCYKVIYLKKSITMVSPNNITVIGRTSGVLDTKAKFSSIGKPSWSALGTWIANLVGSGVSADVAGRFQVLN
jgi:hypothetical protein